MNGSVDSELPSRSNPYTRLRCLGEGATGRVDLAIDTRTGRHVALKRYHRNSPESHNEAAILSGIRHPGIVTLHDAYLEREDRKPTAFVAVYEYIDGEDLVTATRESSTHPRLERFAEAMRALAFVHRRGLLHRDLKPANILVRRGAVAARAVLLDFGFAARAEESSGLFGTLRYLAPEVIEGAKPSERSDLFSMGIVLFELLTGRAPSHGLDAVATLRLHSAGEFALPTAIASNVPVAIRELCVQLLRGDPSRRIGSADEALELLERAGHSDVGGAEELDARIRSLEFGDSTALARELSARFEHARPRVVVTAPEGSDDAIARLRIELSRSGFEFDAPGCPAWMDARDRADVADDRALPLSSDGGSVVVVDDGVPLPSPNEAKEFVILPIGRPDEVVVREAVAADLGIELPATTLPALAAVDGYTPESVRQGLRHLAAQGVLRWRQGRIRCEPFRFHEVRFDERWTGVAAARLKQFSALERDWANALAIAGKPVSDAAVIRECPELRNPASALALARLVERGVVGRDVDGRVFLSSHAFVAAARDSVEGVGLEVRGEAIARALLADAGDDPVRRGDAALALAAHDPRYSAYALLDVGRELRVAGRAAEAEKFLEWFSESDAEHVPSAVIKSAERWLADTASFLGDDARAARIALRALDREASSPNSGDDDARCRAVLARAALRRGEIEVARREIEAGLAVADADPSSRAVLESLSSLALRRLSRVDDALVASRRAIEIAGDRPSAELAGAWMELANTLDDRGEHEGALEAYRRARDVGEAIGRPEVFAHAASNLGRVLLLRGKAQESIGLFESAVRGFEAAVAPALAEGALVNLVWARNSIGDLEGARLIVLRARPTFGRGSSILNRAMFLRHAAETEWRGGNVDAARRMLWESIDLRRRLGANPVVARGEAQLARLEGLLGDDPSARRELARALRDCRNERGAVADCEVLEVACEYHALRGSPVRARRYAARAMRLARAARPERFDASFLAWDALAAWRAGDPAAARESVERSISGLGVDQANGSAALALAIAARLDSEAGDREAETRFDGAIARVAAPGLALERAIVLFLRGGARFERGSALAGARNPEDVRCSLRDLSGARRDADAADALLRGIGLSGSGLAVRAWRARMSESESIGPAVSGFEGLDRRMRGMERLLEINKAINSELDPHRLLNLILDSAISLCAARRGFCVLVKGNQVEVKVARNFSQQDVAHPEFEISHSVARGVARSGEPILTSNALSDSRLRSIASIHELRLLSILCVPLRSRNEVLGSIYLDHPDVVDRFDDVDLALLTDFAWAAGIALERARLYQENLDRTRELLVAKQENERLNAELVTMVKQQQVELVDAKETIEAERSVQALRYDYRTIVTRCERMRDTLRLIDRITETDFPVLVRGESGTGKELVARAIHYNGRRREKNFVAVNCAAMTESLIESVLFGYVKGAFTGADRDRKGLFEVAHEGTLFLDEIGDMTLEVQKRLLRVLQYGEFYRIGAKDPIKVDVRVLCATHRDVKAMIPAGLFRQDLYYRISVAEVNLPPLREREGDVRLLIDHVIQESTAAGQSPPCHFSPAALKVLEGYSWPGNVRELQNEVKRLLFLRTDRPTVDVADLPAFMLAQAEVDEQRARLGASLKDQLAAMEQAIVARALRDAEGNKSEAARRLGISIRGLYKILERGRGGEPGSGVE